MTRGPQHPGWTWMHHPAEFKARIAVLCFSPVGKAFQFYALIAYRKIPLDFDSNLSCLKPESLLHFIN